MSSILFSGGCTSFAAAFLKKQGVERNPARLCFQENVGVFAQKKHPMIVGRNNQDFTKIDLHVSPLSAAAQA
jgi:hypothetical protein